MKILFSKITKHLVMLSKTNANFVTKVSKYPPRLLIVLSLSVYQPKSNRRQDGMWCACMCLYNKILINHQFWCDGMRTHLHTHRHTRSTERKLYTSFSIFFLDDDVHTLKHLTLLDICIHFAFHFQVAQLHLKIFKLFTFTLFFFLGYKQIKTVTIPLGIPLAFKAADRIEFSSVTRDTPMSTERKTHKMHPIFDRKIFNCWIFSSNKLKTDTHTYNYMV